MSNVFAVLFAMMRDAVAAGDVDSERIAAATPTPLREQLAGWRDAVDGIGDLSDGALAACMIGYSQRTLIPSSSACRRACRRDMATSRG